MTGIAAGAGTEELDEAVPTLALPPRPPAPSGVLPLPLPPLPDMSACFNRGKSAHDFI